MGFALAMITGNLRGVTEFIQLHWFLFSLNGTCGNFAALQLNGLILQFNVPIPFYKICAKKLSGTHHDRNLNRQIILVAVK